MNNVSLEEISIIQGSKTFEFLANDGTDSSNIASSIRSFTGDSPNYLKGETWDKVRAKYTKYDEALARHSTIANEISTTIQQTISEIQAAMAGYDSIDISKLEELKEQKKQCEQKIENIKHMMNQKRFNLKTLSFEPVYNNAELQASLDAEMQILAQLDALIKVIETIKAICDKAEAKLNGLLGEMQTIAAGIEDITPSSAM